MASAGQLRHFADPHTLTKTQYNCESTHICDICSTKLAGHVGYRCSECDFDVHEACSGYFKETVSFFAHPLHTLQLSRMPAGCVGWVCDLCREACPPGSFVYRCVQCGFDVHPLCTMLPQVIRSPLHKDHDLCMTPSSGQCGACRGQLPVWHYRCGFCMFNLHIGCVSGAPSGGGEQGSAGGGDNQAAAGDAPTGQQSSGSQSVVVRRSRGTRVAKFLLKRAFFLAIDSATGGLASPVLEILAHAIM